MAAFDGSNKAIAAIWDLVYDFTWIHTHTHTYIILKNDYWSSTGMALKTQLMKLSEDTDQTPTHFSLSDN